MSLDLMYRPDYEKAYYEMMQGLLLQSPVNKCRTIRDWVAANLPGTKQLGSYLDDEDFVARAPVLDVVSKLYDLRLGLMCGGAAQLMKRLCVQNGITVIAGNFGNLRLGLTHMACLVKPAADVSSWYVMDPYWGSELVMQDGSLMEYDEVIRIFQRQSFDLLRSKVSLKIKPEAKVCEADNQNIIEANENWRWEDQRWSNYFEKRFGTRNKSIVYCLPFQADYCPVSK